MSTPTLTPALLCQLTDPIVGAYLGAIGTSGTGYGLGNSGYSYGVAADIASLGVLAAGCQDLTFLDDLMPVMSFASVKSANLVNRLLQPVVTWLSAECNIAGTQLNVASILDLPSFCLYYNIGAGGPWKALLAPDLGTLYQQVFATTPLSPFALYSPPIANMGQRAVGGGFIAGTSVNTVLYAGAGQIQAQVSSFTGSSGTLTVTGNSIDGSGVTHTGRTWTATISENGNVPLTPTNAGDLCTSVTAIALPGGMTGGTVVVAAIPPAGRTYPPLIT